MSIIELEKLVQKIQAFKSEDKKIIYCHGVFDLLHIGHIRYLRQAKQMGDILVVTITPDVYVDKGPHRPTFNESLRAEAIASLDCVDYVAVNKWPTAEETLRLLLPDVYVKGSDFKDATSDLTGKLLLEEQVVNEIGAEMTFTNDIVFSSTSLINRFLSSFSEEVQQYLEVFKSRYSIEDVFGLLDKMSLLKVLVIGDTILDDYCYCHTIGSSSKDPILSVQYDSHDLFAGGVLAVANHVANFVGHVHLATVLGEMDSHKDFIRSKLHDNVSHHFTIQENAPTIIKRRYVEGYSLDKLIEIYIMDDSGLSDEKDNQLCEMVKEELPIYDLVIAADFGHGAISKNLRQTLVNYAPFLAVNTQANAGNRGFHTVSCYSRADYVSIAEHEIRLEMRDERGEIRPMLEKLMVQLNCKVFVVTHGRRGCLACDGNDSFVKVPAFTEKTVDRIGAGDAFLSITALAAFLGADPELIGFIGNVMGALAANTIGNQKSIDKLSVKKFITSLLK